MLMLLPTVLYILLFIHVHSNTTSNASTSTHFQDPCSQMHAPTLLVPTDCLKSQSFFFSFQTSSLLALYYFSFFFATLPYYLLDLFLSLYSFLFFPVQYFIVSSIQTAKVNIALTKMQQRDIIIAPQKTSYLSFLLNKFYLSK